MTALAPEIADRIATARAFVFDMDGTLVLGHASSGGFAPLPGAVALIAALRARGTPFRVFTNGTAHPPAAYAQRLRAAGLDVADDEFMTPSTAAAAWFVRRKLRRIRVLGLDGVQAPLIAAGLDVVGPLDAAEGVEAVFTGWYREFTFPALEAACRDVWAGAMLTTASNVPFFATQGGRAIGASFAINAMIRSLTGTSAKVLGKPAAAALHCALRQMGLPRAAAADTVVVGDDPALEMRMARAGGAFGVAVTTGLCDAADFAARAPAEQPHAVLPGLGPLLEALR